MKSTIKEEILQFGIYLARTAGKKTLEMFNKDIEVISKDDDSPVTAADRMAETWMREQIEKKYPDHGIIGEEFGTSGENKTIKWILDPIDGTRSFIHGVPLYTTLIGVTIDDEPEVGIIYAPATDELCEAATGMGARYNGRPCRVSNTDTLTKASLLSTDITTIREEGMFDDFSHLLDQVKLHRTWGDAYGHMMVATGKADIMFDPVLNVWDAAPLLPILHEAGGVFLDLKGNATINGGNGFSSNEILAKTVLSYMSSDL
ncbi:inositol monophosphatase family protein [Balneolaceae bacterium ANBcel3]|nr:inositol monophosphatase family protein [Balneolaceae bacterium ANBcel3]